MIRETWRFVCSRIFNGKPDDFDLYQTFTDATDAGLLDQRMVWTKLRAERGITVRWGSGLTRDVI